MTSLPVTSLFAAGFAIALLPLTIQVGFKRHKSGILFGDGGDEELARRRAAQDNFVQYVPFALFMMALCELSSMPHALLYGTGGILVCGRLVHAYAMLATDGTGNGRGIGMLLTFLTFILASGWLVIAQIQRG